MVNSLSRFVKRVIRGAVSSDFSRLQNGINVEARSLKLLYGKSLANQVKAYGIYENIQDAEFKVFSQFGDDGILQYLIHQTRPEHHTFIEFGVQDYSEANTRFLLVNDNWSGLIMDGEKFSSGSVMDGCPLPQAFFSSRGSSAHKSYCSPSPLVFPFSMRS